jgi:hypothetical protein
VNRLDAIVAGAAIGSIAAGLLLRARRPRAAEAPRSASGTSAVDAAPNRQRAPTWLKIAWTAFVLALVPVYWREYGPTNFLWFSDLALFALALALWIGSPLLVGMAAVGVLPLEIAWTLDFLAGGRLLDLAGYMFDRTKPLYLRALSLFHLAVPPLTLWLLQRWGYDRRSLAFQTAVGWAVMLATYAVTDPAKNINWVFGPGGHPQTAVPPALYLAGLMTIIPAFVYWPTHLALSRAFPRA